MIDAYIDSIPLPPTIDVLPYFKASVPEPFREFCFVQEWKSPTSTHLLVIQAGGINKVFVKIIVKDNVVFWGLTLKRAEIVNGKFLEFMLQDFYVVTEPVYYPISVDLASVRVSEFDKAMLYARQSFF